MRGVDTCPQSPQELADYLDNFWPLAPSPRGVSGESHHEAHGH